jgi:uncharacterized protein involved in exopolysaccharide biosynthesis
VLPVEQNPEPDDKVDLLALWRVLWRHKLIIVSTTLVCGGIATVLALRAIPVFHAEVAIAEVSEQKMNASTAIANQIGGLANLVGVNLAGGGSAERDAQALLKSRRLAELFVVRNQMLPLLYPKAKKLPSLWMAVRKFRNDVLGIRDDKRNGLTIVGMNWTDPAVAARWSNEYVALANDELRQRAIKESKASVDYLNAQIAQTNVIELQKVMYGLIQNETKTLMLANSRAEYAFTIVDPAVAPEERFSPQRTLMVLMGLVVGGLLGVALAFGRNAWRKHHQAPARTLA